MSVKRPRLPEDLTARIDKARGLVPFDAYVRKALEPSVALDEGDWRHAMDELLSKVNTQILLNHIFMEGYGFHWPDFQEALDVEHANWRRAVEEAAVEQEHEEE